MSQTSEVLGMDIPEPHVDTWNESMGMVTEAFETIDAFAGDVESSIAVVEQTVATASHAVGDYFMLGSVLMRATAAIAVGDQITTSNAVPATIQGQIDSLQDLVSPTPMKSPSYTVASGVTVRSQTKWTRIGHLVILIVQIDIPNANSGSVLVTFSNIPTPRANQNFFTVSNIDTHRGLVLQTNKTLVPSGNVNSGSWLGGTCIYTTDELI